MPLDPSQFSQPPIAPGGTLRPTPQPASFGTSAPRAEPSARAESLGAFATPVSGGGPALPTEPVRRPTPLTPAFGAPIESDAPSRAATPSFVPLPPASAFGGPLPPPPTARPATPSVVRPVAGGGDGQAAPSVRSAPTAPFKGPPAAPAAGQPARVPVAGAPVIGAPVSSAPPLPPAAPATPSSAASAPPARRPINPFLSNDPNQKARRLARALVSDMVAYHPQKREEGARAGTLKQLFREEIKKSYEEYVEQVGREFAESTTHFQEALNDILAGGKRIF
jgi:hypothetical protein